MRMPLPRSTGGFDVEAFDAVVREVYDRHLREAIHPLW